MSCFPCFGGGKSKEDGEAEAAEAAAPPYNMTPPPAVQAPAAYSAAPAPAAAPAAAASPKPGGGERECPQLRFFSPIDFAPVQMSQV